MPPLEGPRCGAVGSAPSKGEQRTDLVGLERFRVFVDDFGSLRSVPLLVMYAAERFLRVSKLESDFARVWKARGDSQRSWHAVFAGLAIRQQFCTGFGRSG